LGSLQGLERQIELWFRLFSTNVALSQQGEKEAENWPIWAYFAMCRAISANEAAR